MRREAGRLEQSGDLSVRSHAAHRHLTRTAHVDGLLLAHGDARLTPALSTAQIGRDFARAYAEMERLEARVWAFGHSHHARTWRKARQDLPAEVVTEGAFSLELPYRYFLNVGTTGLPFPGKGGPGVALVDLEHGRARHIPLPRLGPA